MPYIRFELNGDIPQGKKDAVACAAAEGVTVISGKMPERTMVNIQDRCGLYFHGSGRPIAFVDIRLFNKAEKEQKKLFVEHLYAVLHRELGLKEDDVYMNVTELPSWGKDGSLAFSESWDG